MGIPGRAYCSFLVLFFLLILLFKNIWENTRVWSAPGYLVYFVWLRFGLASAPECAWYTSFWLCFGASRGTWYTSFGLRFGVCGRTWYTSFAFVCLRFGPSKLDGICGHLATEYNSTNFTLSIRASSATVAGFPAGTPSTLRLTPSALLLQSPRFQT